MLGINFIMGQYQHNQFIMGQYQHKTLFAVISKQGFFLLRTQVTFIGTKRCTIRDRCSLKASAGLSVVQINFAKTASPEDSSPFNYVFLKCRTVPATIQCLPNSVLPNSACHNTVSA